MVDNLEDYNIAIGKIENNYVKRVFSFLKGQIKKVSTPDEYVQIHSIVQHQCGDDDNQSDLYTHGGADQEIENLLTENLEIPADMSPQFHRFYENFTKYIDFIIKYEYNILPQQKCYQNINEGANSPGSNNL